MKWKYLRPVSLAMFELYKKTRTVADAETITIGKTGHISISPALTERHFKNIIHVELYFDAATKRIGIKPVPQKTQYSGRLTRPPRSRRAVVSGRGFLGSNKIRFVAEGKFNPVRLPAEFNGEMIVAKVT